jgi:hypothetical protein
MLSCLATVPKAIRTTDHELKPQDCGKNKSFLFIGLLSQVVCCNDRIMTKNISLEEVLQ